MRWCITSLSVLAMAVILTACGASSSAATVAPTQASVPAEAQSLSVAGSTTVQPLAELLAEAYILTHPEVQIDVQGGGSSTGVKSVGEGTVDIGTVSREVKESELTEFPDLQTHVIAYDGIAIAVHPEVGVSDLALEQVRDIFAGVITNWKDLGGADAAIVVVSREEGSGTRDAFQEMVMGKDGPVIVDAAILQPSNGAVRTTVATTPNAVGYLSFGYLDSSVKTLSVGGVTATPENVLNHTYPVMRPLAMLTKGAANTTAQAWLDYILGAAGQKIVADEGFIPVQ